MTALELKNVTFTYESAGEPVLRNVNFHVEHGEVALLAGFSGAGKSTVLRILSGIIPGTIPGTMTGDVLVDGESYTGKNIGAFCRKVGVILQNADEQIIRRSVEDEIAFGCENLAFPPEKIAEQVQETCNLMKLSPQWKPRKLSGGQKQRLLTACVLAMGQKILIMDEPLANLAREGAELVMELARKLAHEENYAVLIVEHRLDVVLPYADAVWNIIDGCIAQTRETPENAILPDPCGPFLGEQDILQVQNLAFSVKRRAILEDVTFSAKRGERLLLLGENGCGKTTLLRCLARLNKPSGGSVQWDLQKKDWFRHMGVVYQNPNYQLFMPTVEREIWFGCRSEERTEEVLEAFRLKEIAQRHPQSLSEGQKRRVSIAAVVASSPEVLLLDEPTVGQDYRGLMELVDILNSWHEKNGTTLITVTHDHRCADALCDHALLLADGKIQNEGGKELTKIHFCSD